MTEYPALDSILRLPRETDDLPENEEFYRRSAEVTSEIEEFAIEDERDEKRDLYVGGPALRRQDRNRKTTQDRQVKSTLIYRPVRRSKINIDWGGGLVSWKLSLKCGHEVLHTKKRNGRVPPRRAICFPCSNEALRNRI